MEFCFIIFVSGQDCGPSRLVERRTAVVLSVRWGAVYFSSSSLARGLPFPFHTILAFKLYSDLYVFHCTLFLTNYPLIPIPLFPLHSLFCAASTTTFWNIRSNKRTINMKSRKDPCWYGGILNFIQDAGVSTQWGKGFKCRNYLVTQAREKSLVRSLLRKIAPRRAATAF